MRNLAGEIAAIDAARTTGEVETILNGAGVALLDFAYRRAVAIEAVAMRRAKTATGARNAFNRAFAVGYSIGADCPAWARAELESLFAAARSRISAENVRKVEREAIGRATELVRAARSVSELQSAVEGLPDHVFDEIRAAVDDRVRSFSCLPAQAMARPEAIFEVFAASF